MGLSYRVGNRTYYRCIDGNYAKHPVAYCTYYHGMLTEKQVRLHKCKTRMQGEQCKRLKDKR